MKKPTNELRHMLQQTFDAFHDGTNEADDYTHRRDEFVFHMTDWLGDLEEIHRAFDNPSQVNPESFSSELYGILVHVLPHLKAAASAYGVKPTDPFSTEALAASTIDHPVTAH